jgi:hypothetical protein
MVDTFYGLLSSFDEKSNLFWGTAKVHALRNDGRVDLVAGYEGLDPAPRIATVPYLTSYTPRVGDIVHILSNTRMGVVVLGSALPRTPGISDDTHTGAFVTTDTTQTITGAKTFQALIDALGGLRAPTATISDLSAANAHITASLTSPDITLTTPGEVGDIWTRTTDTGLGRWQRPASVIAQVISDPVLIDWMDDLAPWTVIGSGTITHSESSTAYTSPGIITIGPNTKAEWPIPQGHFFTYTQDSYYRVLCGVRAAAGSLPATRTSTSMGVGMRFFDSARQPIPLPDGEMLFTEELAASTDTSVDGGWQRISGAFQGHQPEPPPSATSPSALPIKRAPAGAVFWQPILVNQHPYPVDIDFLEIHRMDNSILAPGGVIADTVTARSITATERVRTAALQITSPSPSPSGMYLRAADDDGHVEWGINGLIPYVSTTSVPSHLRPYAVVLTSDVATWNADYDATFSQAVTSPARSMVPASTGRKYQFTPLVSGLIRVDLNILVAVSSNTVYFSPRLHIVSGNQYLQPRIGFSSTSSTIHSSWGTATTSCRAAAPPAMYAVSAGRTYEWDIQVCRDNTNNTPAVAAAWWSWMFEPNAVWS